MLAPVAWLRPGNGTGRVAVAVLCHAACSSSIFWSMAGLPCVLLGASGLVRKVVHVQGAQHTHTLTHTISLFLSLSVFNSLIHSLSL